MTTPDITLERGLPASIDAERSVLGAILLENRAYVECSGSIEAEDFALDSHRRIYRRMEDLLLNGRVADIVTLSEELGRHKEVEAIGGVAYLASLTEGLPRRLSIEEYVRIVKEKSLARQAIHAWSRGITIAADQTTDIAEVIEELRETAQILGDKATSEPLRTFGDYIKKKYPNIEMLDEQTALSQGVPTGFGELDDYTCGFQPEDFIVIAARPSMGKTAWAVNVAANQTIRLQKRVAFFSLEMTKRAILDRIRSSEAKVELEDILKGRVSHVARRYLAEALNAILDVPFYIDDEPAQTVPQMLSKCSLLKQREGLDEVIIDQLTHIELPPRAAKGLSRVEQVGLISRQLKRMAKVLKVPVVVLHQLNREVTKRTDKTPNLGDLRESGAIEQDADVVAFIHREYYYDRDPANEHQAKLIIAKQRQGRIGTINLLCNLPCCSFETHPDWIEKQRQGGIF